MYREAKLNKLRKAYLELIAHPDNPHNLEWRDNPHDEPSIYIDIAYREAVVVEINDAEPYEYVATAYAWDQTGGVSAEHWIGSVPEEDQVADLVLPWIDRYLKRMAEVEAQLAAANPEEI